MAKRTGFTDPQKIAIATRDQVCVVHFESHNEKFHFSKCNGDLVAHHRRGRGMGGSKARNRVANGLLVCSEANSMFESDAEFASLARDRGWLLRTDYEIDSVQVWIPWLNRGVTLNDAGEYLDPSGNIIQQVIL